MKTPTRARDAMRFSFRLPVLFLRGSYAQLVLAVIALTIAVATVCMFGLVNRAILLAFTEVVDTMAGRAALQVVSGEGGLLAENVAQTVAKVAGVELAVPVVSATAFTSDDRGDTLTVLGVDITDEPAVRLYEPGEALLSGTTSLGIDDPLVFLSQPDSIALTQTFAEARGLRVGQTITLDTPTGRTNFTVRGLLQPAGVARVFGGNLAVMDIQAAERVFSRPGFINRVDVVVRRSEDVAAVARALTAALPAGLGVVQPEQRKADLHRAIRSLQLLLWGVALILLVVCFLIAFNRLSTHFEARAWHAAVIRAVGVRQGAVWRELLKESAVLGMAGIVFGLPLGIALGHVLLVPMIGAAAAVNFKVLPPSAELTIQASSLVLAAAVGLGAALLAAALPSWRSVSVSVSEVLRRRGLEQGGTSSRAGWLLRGGVGLGIAVALGIQAFSDSPIPGLVATPLIAAATVLVARPLLRLLQAPLMPCLYWLAGPTGPFAWSAILDYPRRTALTMGMIGVGLGCVLWLLTIGRSFEQTLIYAQTGAVRAELVVGSAHVASGWIAAPIDEGLLAELAETPGVAAVTGNRLIDWPYQGESIVISAFDPEYLAREDFGRWLLLDESSPDAVWQAAARGEGVVVSTNLARRFHAGVNDRIELDTATGPVSLPILGITMNFASPTGTMLMSRALYASRWEDHQITGAYVRTAPGVPVAAVQEAIARRLGSKYRLRIFAAGELVDYWAEQVRRAFAGVRVVRGLVFVALLAGLADTLVAGVIQRIRELGMTRAVGIRRWQLQRMIVVEGLILGGLGLLLAAAMGTALGALWVYQTFPSLLGHVLQLHIPYRDIVSLAVMTVVVGLCAAVPAAHRIARLEPAAALRYE